MNLDTIPFVKAEANGNDFIIIDGDAVPAAGRASFTRGICDRNRGVGADGVEFVRSVPGGFHLVLFNADGGEAELSGNGTRCVAAFYAQRGFREGVLHTAAGPVHAAVVDGPAHISGKPPVRSWTIELGMGVPRLEGEISLRVLDRDIAATTLSMGNPQCLVRVDEFPADWETLGAAIETHPQFPHRTNVEFIRVLDRHSLELRIFERGVGPTKSSGTGSCAAAVAAIVHGWADSPLQVATPGGHQRVRWSGPGTPVTLLGPARIVAEGIYYIPSL